MKRFLFALPLLAISACTTTHNSPEPLTPAIPTWAETAMNAKKPEFNRCYLAFAKDGKPAGTIETKFTVVGTSHVRELGMQSTTLQNSQIETCVLKVIKTMTFTPPNEEPVEIVYPLTFPAKS